MKTFITRVAALMLVATVTWAASIADVPDRRGQCLTENDVLWHQMNSRTGISLTCMPEMVSQP